MALSFLSVQHIQSMFVRRESLVPPNGKMCQLINCVCHLWMVHPMFVPHCWTVYHITGVKPCLNHFYILYARAVADVHKAHVGFLKFCFTYAPPNKVSAVGWYNFVNTLVVFELCVFD